MHEKKATRYFIYGAGIVILAFGISLNTKTDLGTSPLISLPYSISEIWELNFALLAFIMYSAFTILEIILEGKSRKRKDWLQLPFSLVFSLLLQLFDSGYDYILGIFDISIDALWARSVMLIFGVIFTGIGISMTVNMNLVPNPADGLAKVVGERCHRNLGFGKNLIDTISVLITCCLSLTASGRLVGVGIGTVVAMIGVGRCVFVFNHFCKEKMLRSAGFIE